MDMGKNVTAVSRTEGEQLGFILYIVSKNSSIAAEICDGKIESCVLILEEECF